MDATGTGRLTYTTSVDVSWRDEQGKEKIIPENRTYFLDLGVITRIEEVFSKSTSATPRTSMSAEDTFVLENGSSLTLTITFERVNPVHPNDNSLNYWIQPGTELPYDPYGNTPDGDGDYIENLQDVSMMSLLNTMRMNGSTKWSNNKWYREMTAAVDRWQTKTDGFKFMYIPDQNGDSRDNPYIPAYNHLNGYVKSLRRVYKAGDPTVLQCTLEFHVGTIHLSLGEEEETLFEYSHLVSPSAPYIELSISDPHSMKTQIIHSVNKNGSSSEESFLDSESDFTLSGGPNNPFECLEFAISRYHLQMVDIGTGYISEGTLVNLRAFADQSGRENTIPALDEVEKRTFVLKSATQSGTVRSRKYKLQAYCVESQLTSDVTTIQIVDKDPWTIIEGILTGEYSLKAIHEFGIPEGYIRHNVNLDARDSKISVEPGVNLWSLLKVCANILHAKVFFADGHMYLVDYSVKETPGSSGQSSRAEPPLEDLGSLILHGGDMRGRLNGMVSDKTSVTSDYMVNFTSAGLSASELAVLLEEKDVSIGRWDSIDLYGYYEQPLDLDSRITLDKNAYEAYRMYLLDYYAYPQTPLQFTLKELYSSKTNNGFWRVTYPPAAFARIIEDEVGGFSNNCQPKTKLEIDEGEEQLSVRYVLSDEVRPSTLMLSSYTRDFWTCQTQYTFGEIGETSLSKALSK